MREKFWPRMRIVHYLIHKSGEKIIAHCLDLDLVASGQNAKIAEERLDVIVRKQIEHALTTGNTEVLCTEAPDEFWTMLNNCKHVSMGAPLLIELPARIPTYEVGVMVAAEPELVAA